MTISHSRHVKRTKAYLATIVMLLPSGLHAADLPRPVAASFDAPSMPQAFSWTGVYAGANLGGGFSTGNAFNGLLGTTSGKASGVSGGAQVGYNYQVSPLFVVGIENDVMATGISTGKNSNPYVSLPFFGSGRARGGLALLDSRLLVYGTAGLAFGQVQDAGIKNLRFGWTAGGGVEYALSERWSVRLEGLYTDLYKGTSSGTFADRHAKFITARAGLNYHFDLFRASHVADGY